MKIVDLWVMLLNFLRWILPALFAPQSLIIGTATLDGVAVGGVGMTLTNKGTGETYTAITMDDGTFAFQPVKMGDYVIDAFKDNGDGSHLAGSLDIVVSSAAMTVNVTLAKVSTQYPQIEINSSMSSIYEFVKDVFLVK
jgi:hypothetical protein